MINLWRYVVVVAVLPLLLGHALGAKCDLENNCPVITTYNLLGGPLSVAQHKGINHRGALSISYNGGATDSYTAAESVSTSGPYSFSLTDETITQLRIKVAASTGNSELGEAWFASSAGTLKLTEAIKASTRLAPLELTFVFDPGDFTLPQSSRIASGSLYSLSADATGAQWLYLGTKTDVYRNDELLFSTRSGSDIASAPKLFEAEPGDVLRFHIESDIGFYQTSDLWLHRPDGFGLKLLQRVRTEGVVMPLDFQFVIP